MSDNPNFMSNVEKSALYTFIMAFLLFFSALLVVIIIPNYMTDPSWIEPSSIYQKQMYEISDPNVYISSSTKKTADIQTVYHLKEGFSLIAFQETDTIKILADDELSKFITKKQDPQLKLTSEILLLRNPSESLQAKTKEIKNELKDKWAADHTESDFPPDFLVFELYRPEAKEVFALGGSSVFLENWVDEGKFVLLNNETSHPYHKDHGVIYINNPIEYRVKRYKFGPDEGWTYHPEGNSISSLKELKSHELGFLSRKELIELGEHIYSIEGCWYCHTDQTRTLVQDTVLNGSESYPAPPSSPNEYIYQTITFPGTKRNGPDISRVGVKRPSRDWHKSHFWSPKTESPGSIMPAFQHFFDNDPRGTNPTAIGVPNYKFEAIFQYLMTKGTRITPPTEAWWLGKDPVRTIDIIEGRGHLP